MRYVTLLHVSLSAIVMWSGLAAGPEPAWGRQPHEPPAPTSEHDYTKTVADLRKAVHDELNAGMISGVSIGLIDGQRTILAEGFGLADKNRAVQPDADTIVYRVGSISKLFTALAAMQLVEQGKLDIDARVEEVFPSFRIQVPFDDCGPITLRNLMCHRSGMIREAPVGNYFDSSGPGLTRTVASLAGCALVNPVNTKTRYSNVGPTIVGRVLAHVSGVSFADYQEAHVLRPLGMEQSAWLLNKNVRKHLATGYMRVANAQGGFFHREAPLFDLSTIPAGNLYSTTADMARFAKMLLAGGRSGPRRLIKRETLGQMWTPQLTKEKKGFGLGFLVGEFAGHKSVQHTGAVYGFTCSIVVLPKAGIAVIVLCNDDIALGPVVRISHAALEAMLEAKLGQKPPAKPAPVALDRAQLSALTGDFESPSYWAEIRLVDDRLQASISGQTMTLVPIEPLRFEADGLRVHREPVHFLRDEQQNIVGFTALEQTFTCVKPAERRDIPEPWRGYLGSYGPDYIPLIVSQRNGRLYAMAENVMDYRLTPLNRFVFKLSKGLYEDEYLVFHVGPDGRAHSVDLANITLRRQEPPLAAPSGTGQPY